MCARVLIVQGVTSVLHRSDGSLVDNRQLFPWGKESVVRRPAMMVKSELFLWKEPLAKRGESCPFVRFQATSNHLFLLRDGLVHLNK